MKNTEVDGQAKELNGCHGVEPTKVKVRFTIIKFYNDESNNVETIRLLGKMGVAQCKGYVKGINKNNLFIEKTSDDEEFSVDTVLLYGLKLS